MEDYLTIHCDGASKGNPGPASIGAYASQDGEEIFTISQKIGVATNNQAEWNSLLESLVRAKKMEFKRIHVFMDSELVVRQMTGIYKVKNPEIKLLKEKVDKILPFFQDFKIEHVRREKNKVADGLANAAFS